MFISCVRLFEALNTHTQQANKKAIVNERANERKKIISNRSVHTDFKSVFKFNHLQACCFTLSRSHSAFYPIMKFTIIISFLALAFSFSVSLVRFVSFL